MLTELQERIEAIGEQLRAKINSKFQVSAFLAGFAITVLSVQISEFLDNKLSLLQASLSISLLIAAIVLFIFLIVRLDELTMPKRFWDRDENTNIPLPEPLGSLNDQDLWTLKERMVFYWVWLAYIAIGLTALSFLCMLVPWSNQKVDEIEHGMRWLSFGSFLVVGIASFFYVRLITRKASMIGSLHRPVD
jgi:hypothetical protein